jgi:hypothetical protein
MQALIPLVELMRAARAVGTSPEECRNSHTPILRGGAVDDYNVFSAFMNGSVALTVAGYNEPTGKASLCSKTKQLAYQTDFARHAWLA